MVWFDEMLPLKLLFETICFVLNVYERILIHSIKAVRICQILFWGLYAYFCCSEIGIDGKLTD